VRRRRAPSTLATCFAAVGGGAFARPLLLHLELDRGEGLLLMTCALQVEAAHMTGALVEARPALDSCHEMSRRRTARLCRGNPAMTAMPEEGLEPPTRGGQTGASCGRGGMN
jgi:hypothetical protein